jgi:predicted metal-binding protein
MALAARLCDALAADGVQLLRVNCLGACRQPCAVALDEPHKARLRFSNLSLAHVADLGVVLRRYRESDSGCLPLDSLPLALRSRLSAVSPKPLNPNQPGHSHGT